jgi:hypothetical protein
VAVSYAGGTHVLRYPFTLKHTCIPEYRGTFRVHVIPSENRGTFRAQRYLQSTGVPTGGGSHARGSPVPVRADFVAAPDDLIRTSIFDKFSGSMKFTTRLDHNSHRKTASGTNWSNRWTYRIPVRADFVAVPDDLALSRRVVVHQAPAHPTVGSKSRT